MGWYRYDEAKNLVLTLYIQPGAKNTAADGLHGEALKIKLAAPPVEGKANSALIKFLAERFDVPLSHVILKQGDKSRHKVIMIQQPAYGPEMLFSEAPG
ncbi:MAG: YggU family protein [Proteobacteria bacterium]|nr:YggU family protein [Pseudomonadota bacterium]